MASKDDQLLFSLQRRLKNGDAQAMTEMYEKLVTVAYKIINNRSRSNKYIEALSAEERQQKAHDAATYIIEQYLKRPNFEITDSVTGYLYTRVAWELYGQYQRKCDQMIVYVDELPEHNDEHIVYKYIVTNINSGQYITYTSATEILIDPKYKGLRKNRLIEALKTGRRWKNYHFEIMEVTE